MKHLFFLLIFSLFVMSCQDEFSKQDETSLEYDITETSVMSRGGSGDCPNCPNLMINGSFEQTNVPIPFQQQVYMSNGEVPNWYSAWWSPDVFVAEDGCSVHIPTTSVDGKNVMGFIGRRGVISPGVTNELPFQNVSIRNDQDLTYCLTLSHKAGGTPGGSPGGWITDLDIYTVKGLPPVSAGNNPPPGYNTSGFDNYNGEKIVSTRSYEDWTTETFSFQPEKENEQIVFHCSGLSYSPGVYNQGVSVLDKIELTCQSDALVGVVYVDNPDGTTTLSPVWNGLPNDVSIVTYDWRDITGNVDGSGNMITTFPHSTGAGQEVCLSIIDSRGCCATVCETFPSLCPIEFTVKANDIYYSNDNDGVYNNKEMTVLWVSTCDNVHELWGVEDIPYVPGTCLENIHYEDSALINCGEDPFGPIDNCDPNALLALGQAALTAICPDAILTADDNFKTWMITLPADNSCEITTLGLNGYNAEYDASCTGLSNVTGNTKDIDDCVCSL